MTPPPATCTYDDDFLPRTAADELLQQCASLSFLQDRKGMTCKSVQHVDKAIYFLGNADPPRRAHYYWGQDLAEVTRGEPMPRFLLELRAKVIEALQLPDKVRVTVKVPGWACTAVGDEVASLNHCVVNRYANTAGDEGRAAKVTPHHDGQAGATPGVLCAVVAGTAICTVTVCDPGAERLFQLHEVRQASGGSRPCGVAWEERFSHGSLFQLGAAANGEFKHGVAPSTDCGARYALIFRTTVEALDETLASRAEEGEAKRRAKRAKN